MGAAMGCPQQFPQQIPQQNPQQIPQQIPQQFATPQPMGDPVSASMAQMAAQQFAMYPPPGGGQAHAPVTPMPPLMQQQSQMTQPPNKPRVPVTTAGIPIFKMPKKHSVAIIEHIEPLLDSVIFGPVGPKELSMVIWLLTRVNPSTNIHEFHVDYYDELPAKFKKKADRLKADDESAFNENVHKLINSDCNIPGLYEMCINNGFDPAFLATDKKRVKQEEIDRAAELHSMFKRRRETTSVATPQSVRQLPAQAHSTYMMAIVQQSLDKIFMSQRANPPPLPLEDAPRLLQIQDDAPRANRGRIGGRRPSNTEAEPVVTVEQTRAVVADGVVPAAPVEQQSQSVLDAGEPAADALTCRICLAPYAEAPVEALLCGHTFHTECIDRSVQITGRSRENCCPFKCNLKEDAVDLIARENSIATAASEAAVRAADTTRAAADASLASESSVVTAANETAQRQRDEAARRAAADTQVQVIPDDEEEEDDDDSVSDSD